MYCARCIIHRNGTRLHQQIAQILHAGNRRIAGLCCHHQGMVIFFRAINSHLINGGTFAEVKLSFIILHEHIITIVIGGAV